MTAFIFVFKTYRIFCLFNIFPFILFNMLNKFDKNFHCALPMHGVCVWVRVRVCLCCIFHVDWLLVWLIFAEQFHCIITILMFVCLVIAACHHLHEF